MQGEVDRVYKKYLTIDEDRIDEKQANCEHKIWITRCSCCNAVIDNSKTHEDKDYEEILI
jgi:hypothetical protein